jgi:hypothetical protein
MPIHDWKQVPAGVFHDFHTTWIPDIKRTLIEGALPPGYYAMVEQFAAGNVPDVLTLQRVGPVERNGASRPSAPQGGGVVALAEAPPRTRLRDHSSRDPYTSRARSIAVRHSSDDRLVAVIEIVSPGNKSSAKALATFVEKAAQFLRAGVHLLIIDLFPPGKSDPRGLHAAIWAEFSQGTAEPLELPREQPLLLASYLADDEVEAFLDPMSVGDSIPVAPLFLTTDHYINLPLEPSYMSAYATVPARWRDVLESPSV